MSAKQTVAVTGAKEDVAAVVANTALNTSQKIRALAALEVSRSEIALLLEKRYQHVRNVLLTPLTSK
jgi:hypothetical protein